MGEQAERLVLTITQGEDEGRQVIVDRGACKVVGRSVDQDQTVLTEPGQIVLQQEDMARIMKYLVAKSTTSQEEKAAAIRNPFGSYTRRDDAILHDEAISRVHAMIFLGDQGAGILDIGSTNGTYVNGERVNVHTLSEGDEIRMGNIIFKTSLE